jgi:hypothetical protein
LRGHTGQTSGLPISELSGHSPKHSFEISAKAVILNFGNTSLAADVVYNFFAESQVKGPVDKSIGMLLFTTVLCFRFTRVGTPFSIF